MATPKPLAMSVYEGPLKSFDQWSKSVEVVWMRMLRRAVDDESARAAMKTAMPLFRAGAMQAYGEYVAGWKRRERDRRRAERKQTAKAD